MALKRKNCSSAWMYDFHQSTPAKSSTNVAENDLPGCAGNENEMSVRKKRRTNSFEKLLLYFCDFSDQTAAPIYERRAEDTSLDRISLQSIDWSLEDTFSDLEPVSERSDSQERQKRRKSSFEKLPSLHLLDWSGSSGQGQKVEDQITAATGERRVEDETKQTSFVIGQKRKSSLSTPTTSSTNAAENHLPVGAGEEQEMPMRKKRRKESLEKLLSLKSIKWNSGSDQTTIHEKQLQDHISLQSISWSVEDLEESLTSDPEDLPPAVKQVQSPPAPVHPSLVSPASARNSIVDLTTEDEFLSRYEIGKLLGEGGNGCVYEGKRWEDGLEVAVKFASKPRNMKYISVPGHPAPLPLEIGLLLLVNKESRVPEIIQLLDWQDQPERYIMVLERPSPCKDLFDYAMLQGGFLSEDTAQVIMVQATKAAYMCCQRGVFHRDIKQENLLINPETLEVKLIDFGCGDLLQDSGYERFCGTLEYCPPEYFVDHKYHGKPTTVWSLGMLLFLLVCGNFPEPKETELINDDIWFRDELSNECCHLIRSLLNESPSERIDLEEILLHDWFKVTKQPQRFLH
ncbi:hypothetical protein QQF64_029673 [Cirrhinus molitorella]|uniref:non-specific serine/threonine protein kinase n=1 Tax=Cirrhinus molitorella TaxID=172907 RepID=A0ABR3N1G1_9TELE